MPADQEWVHTGCHCPGRCQCRKDDLIAFRLQTAFEHDGLASPVRRFASSNCKPSNSP